MSKKFFFRAGAIATAILFFMIYVAEIDSYARAGGGRSSGSRGSRSSYSSSRSYSSPSSGYSSQNYQSQRSYSNPYNQNQTRRSGGFLRSLGGGLMGGFLGAMLFRSLGFGGMMGGGAGSGLVGLINILIIGLIIYAIYRFIKNRNTGSSAPALKKPMPEINNSWQAGSSSGDDISGGLGQIRWADSSFNDEKFKDGCMDHFFKVQGAWANRDMSPVRNMLTDEMYSILQKDADTLKSEKKINRLDNIAVRSTDIVEAWQENGADYITVKYLANLLDYTVDESTGSVLSGRDRKSVV